MSVGSGGAVNKKKRTRWAWFGDIHRAVYRATGGRIGGHMAGLAMLLLATRGRRSGELRTVPMPFFRDGDDFVIVGSNNGAPRDPAWWFNLRAKPEAEIQVMREHIPVRARLATTEERARLWPLLTAYNSAYLGYEKKTSRLIPVVILSPVS